MGVERCSHCNPTEANVKKLVAELLLGLCAGKRFAWKDAPGYIGAQLVGAIVAARRRAGLIRLVVGDAVRSAAGSGV
jgi:hypothetical protein